MAAAAAAAAASSSSAAQHDDGCGLTHMILHRKPPGPWTELETNHLIDAYQEKWYALKRGQLKARHWEEVANLVFLRCGGIEPTKSSVQCRHKIEKLRKRYRTEKQQEISRGPGCSKWVFFERMDLLEHGPPPTRPDCLIPANGRQSTEHDSDTTENNNNNTNNNGSHAITNHPRTFHLLLDKGGYQVGLPSDNDAHFLSLHAKNNNLDFENNSKFAKASSSSRSNVKRRKPADDDDDDDGEPHQPHFRPQPQPQPHPQPQPLSELASVVRSLGEGFMRIEQMKMEMQRDSERLRMEMEMKRTEMILESQQHIADVIAKAFSSKKKFKKLQSPDL